MACPPCGREPEIARPEQRQSIADLVGWDGTLTGDHQGAADTRRRLRVAYNCDCSGPVGNERCDVEHDIVARSLDAIADWTGDRPRECPWRAFDDEYVGRVLEMWDAWKERQLAVAFPQPSHREMGGILFYSRVSAAVEVKHLEEQRKNREAPGAR